MLVKSFLFALFLPTLALAEWPRWRGPAGDGTWNPADVPANYATREPEQLWKTPIASGYGGVTISQGRVYVMDRPKSPADTERLLCLDASTGNALWSRSWPADYGSMEYATGPRSSVTIHEGHTYSLGAVGMAMCVKADTGEPVWRVDMVKEHSAQVPTWGFAASPVIDGPRVLLHVGAGKEGSVVALDRSTGKLVWRGGPDPAGYCTPEIITHAGRRQLIAWGPEHVQSLDPETGKLFWKWPYKITYGVSIAQPFYHDGLLLVSGYWHGTKVLRLGDQPGQVSLAWENEKGMCGLMSAPLYKDGVVYLLDKDKGLQGIELTTGKILWSDGNTLTPKDRNPQMSLVWLKASEGLATLLNASGELVHVKLSPQGMEELGRHQIIGKTWAHPAFSDSQIWARSDTEMAAWRLW